MPILIFCGWGGEYVICSIILMYRGGWQPGVPSYNADTHQKAYKLAPPAPFQPCATLACRCCNSALAVILFWPLVAWLSRRPVMKSMKAWRGTVKRKKRKCREINESRKKESEEKRKACLLCATVWRMSVLNALSYVAVSSYLPLDRAGHFMLCDGLWRRSAVRHLLVTLYADALFDGENTFSACRGAAMGGHRLAVGVTRRGVCF